jgi:hypothetical protein
MRCLTSACSALMFVAMIAYAAEADTDCPDGTVPSSGGPAGTICIPAVDPGSGGSGSDADGPGGGTGGGGTGEPSGPDPCTRYEPLEPQPPASSQYWGGNSPDDGRLVLCIPPGAGNPTYVFVPDGDDPPPDPAELGRKALGQLKLLTPEVHLAPAPPAQTYVGLDTWLWMPPGQWSSLKKSVKAGDTTVTVTAVPKSVLWDMGPGSTTCYSAGRVWKTKEMPTGSTTDCSYKYEKISDFEPGKKFKVAATITYQVDWTCDGECLSDEGTLGEVPGPAGGAAISVGERQSVVVSGGKKQ